MIKYARRMWTGGESPVKMEMFATDVSYSSLAIKGESWLDPCDWRTSHGLTSFLLQWRACSLCRGLVNHPSLVGFDPCRLARRPKRKKPVWRYAWCSIYKCQTVPVMPVFCPPGWSDAPRRHPVWTTCPTRFHKRYFVSAKKGNCRTILKITSPSKQRAGRRHMIPA